MVFFEFPGIKISALAAAVPDHKQNIMDYEPFFKEGEIKKFCETTGVYERYIGNDVRTIASDLCAAAANEIFKYFGIDRGSIDGVVFLSQSPDYSAPPTACVLQYRLGLDNCGVAYDSNIGCTGFLYGLQMACMNVMYGCKRVLVLAGDGLQERAMDHHAVKDSLLFGDCGVAAVVEKTEDSAVPIRLGIHTIGKGYKSLIVPYGGERHPMTFLFHERGMDALNHCGPVMDGTDVFTFSIKDVPQYSKEFMRHFDADIQDYDLISIHQANKLITDTIAKRIKAPKDKVISSIDKYGNTSGAATALNICDYAERQNIHSGTKRIYCLAFGIGLNIAAAGFELDMSRCLPVVKTKETFDDGIDNYTYF